MAKQAALSIRILESIKRDLDKAAARQHRSTSSLVEKILDDYLREEKRQARVAAGHSALPRAAARKTHR
jgi:predicted transcriptional regulator